jgi:uncharacterized membrane protein YgaE (UPF0421/DUF939 family)
MSPDFSLRPHATPVGTTMRAVARRALDRVVQAQPVAASIARLTATAVFAYFLTWLLPGTAQSILAPLTAVLVVQATSYQTLRSAVHRVSSVVVGVLLALGFSTAVGMTWWSLGLIIAVALIVGSVLKLGHHMLEVPISAMLILSVRADASGRIVDTIVGTVAGLIGGIVFSRIRTRPAEDAIGNLSRQMADLLDEIASGLDDGSNPGETEARLVRAHALKGEIQRADHVLGEAEDSLRLRPPALRSARTAAPLRNGLETLERAALTITGLARSITDARLPESDGAALAADAMDLLAEVLRQLAAAVRVYGGLVRADLTTGLPDGSELERHLAEARQHQDRLAPVLRHTPDATSVGWPLRGEILVHLDRLTNGLRAEHIGHARDDERPAGLRVPWPRRPAPATSEADDRCRCRPGA